MTGLFFIATFLISYAHDFEVDGIYYNKNANETSVIVTYRGNSDNAYSNEYSGNVVIPSSVTYSGNTYAVTSIGNYAFSNCSGLTSSNSNGLTYNLTVMEVCMSPFVCRKPRSW